MIRLAAFRRRFRWLCLAGLGLAGLGLAVLGVHLERASRVEVLSLSPPPGPLVLDHQGQVLRLGPDAWGRRKICLPPGPVPPVVVAAFVAAEDQRFWQHPGVDPLAVIRALGSNVTSGRIVSGASTITMQLSRLANPGPRTYRRKLVEMCRSFRIEMALSKSDILRCYLDQVPMGNNLVGVEAAAYLYFGKTAAQLQAGEAALLAALTRAPGTLNPYGPNRPRLMRRQEQVLHRMAALGLINETELAGALSVPLILREAKGRAPKFPFEAPHFVNLLLGPQAGAGAGPVRTTLDLDLQRRAAAILASHRARLLRGGAAQAAAVIVDNHTLGVLALVGSLRYGPRDCGFNNGAGAWRSPGSTLKPFLYAQALDLGFTPASILEDLERRYHTPGGEFIPANFDRYPHGPVAFREALGNSLNLSAVSLLNLVEPQNFYRTLTKLRLINHPGRTPEHYGLGLVVGNPEVSLLQLAAAYASLANGGLFRPLRFQRDDPAPQPGRVFSPQAAYIISAILADPTARARAFEGSTAMNPPYRMALKTGTSTRYRDCWAVGYTPEYTVAVWVGNFDGRSTYNQSGAAEAAPILTDLAAQLFPLGPPRDFVKPAGVTSAPVCHFSGLKPGPDCLHQRQEQFLAGTEPATLCTFHPSREPWHRMPTNFAGWLRQRFEKKAMGRYRLADFDAELPQVFQDQGANPKSSPAAIPYAPAKVSLGRSPAELSPAPPPGAAVSPLTITYPLNGDRYLLAPRSESLEVAVKAVSQAPVPAVTWFLNGREALTTGPPYETTLRLGRGRHRLTVTGPDALGDSIEVHIQ
jgi:penicillin-binding protein 1C